MTQETQDEQKTDYRCDNCKKRFKLGRHDSERCPHCDSGWPHVHQVRKRHYLRKEDKPCEGCGFVRRIEIHKGWSENKPEQWEPHCHACQLAIRARHYQRLAASFAARAREQYAKQAASAARRPQGEGR